MKKLFLSEGGDLLTQYNALQKLSIMISAKVYDYKVVIPARGEEGKTKFLFEGICEHQCLSIVAKLTNMKNSLHNAAAVLMTGKHDKIDLIEETFKKETDGYSLQDFIDDANLRYIEIEDEMNLMKIEEAMCIIRMNIPDKIMKQKEHQSIDTANKILNLINLNSLGDTFYRCSKDIDCLIQSTTDPDDEEKSTDSEQI